MSHEGVRVAILGLGRIGTLLEEDTKREKPASHAGAFAATPGASLVAGWDPDAERREKFERRWGASTRFSGPEDLLVSTKPDVLVIATSADNHVELVDLACKQGVRVVVCEKPVTLNMSAGRALLQRVSRSATKVLVNHERRYARDYRRVRQIVEEGRYGSLQMVSAKLFLGRGRTPGEVLVWDGTHMFDILRYLTGQEVGSISTWGRAELRSGVVLARFTLGSTQVVLETAANRDHLVFELDLGFERGRVRIGNGLYQEFVGAPSPLYDAMRSLVEVPVEPSELYPTQYFSGMAADALSCALDGSRVPVSSLTHGWAALEAVDRILRKSGSSVERIGRLSGA